MHPLARSLILTVFAGLLSAVLHAVLPVSHQALAQSLAQSLAQTRTATTKTPPSLEQRRQIRRDGAIRSRITQCRGVAKRVEALKTRPCVDGDRLDPARNLCLPGKARYRPYLRWDPAAGRCRPRDKYEQGSCAGPRARYHPGKRHAHNLAGSIRMYGASTRRAEAALRQCSAALDRLRNASATRFQTAARNCAIARKLQRRDLIARYCK